MNTNALKKFAQETRRKLMEQVAAKMQYVLHTDSPVLREKSLQVQALRQAIEQSSESQVIDKVAYTWFNRLMALRFMDANDYQPLGIRIITPKEGYTLPELLDEAKQGNIPTELTEGSRPLVNTRLIHDLLDGRIPSHNAQNEVYTHLLIGACNHLSQVFPFLYERIEDYSELLLPDDLTSERSVVSDIRTGMNDTDCQEVEIIGWLYQFYISEKKDELINAKKKYKADEIAPVTQLFTPRWLVEYMVDNTLGQYWTEVKPSSLIANKLQFYVKPDNVELIQKRKSISPEDIKFFDPCVGSAHVLCYAFDVFYKIYEEEGYDPTIIPELILTKNLYGLDIDDRAAQLASFALMMKGRKHQRRFFRKNIEPNVLAYKNTKSHPKFENAKILGSLIKITPQEVEKISVNENSLFEQTDTHLKKQATFLANKYDVVVTNPPYLNSSYMEDTLKSFVEKEYNETKTDLFACFITQASNFTKSDGLIGFICPYVWMFIQSYEKLRSFVISNTTISTLVQLEYNAFGPAVVPIASFVLRNQYIENYKGTYIRLSEFKGEENQAPKTLEAIQNPNCGWLYKADQKNFEKIAGNPIGYWLSKIMLDVFDNVTSIDNIASPRQGLASSNNGRFLKIWFEVERNNISFDSKNRENAVSSSAKWFPYNKGGSFRKWFGNNDFVINWQDDGKEILAFASSLYGSPTRTIKNIKFYFQPSITWSALTTGGISLRKNPHGFLFDTKGQCIFSDDDNILNYLMALLNSKVANEIMKVLAPTLDFNSGVVAKVPYLSKDIKTQNIIESVEISKQDWNSRETSWDFQANELLRIKGKSDIDLEEAYDLYKAYWQKKFMELHRNEEALNRQFIEIYGLQDELTPDVPLEDITILKEETSIQNNQLVFDATEVMAQFVSYAVGCTFGRYSLLVDSGQLMVDSGSDPSTIHHEPSTNKPSTNNPSTIHHEPSTNKPSTNKPFLPDDDNIIPVLDDEWFEDDIVGRFKEFLKVTFGTANFERNLAFVEESLGKDIRKYFVKDFYADHIKRYKKRPIYWMFSSGNGSFNVLIYMHRYTPDTLNKILNGYLVEYREKLNNRIESLNHIIVSGSSAEQTKAAKEKDKIKKTLLELKEYEREILYPLATERINIDLDDGVLVNYNKFGAAIKEISGLNDKATKKKVKDFDWIDGKAIR